jgi:hypothetical protein
MNDHELDTKEQSREYVVYMQERVLRLRPKEFAMLMTLKPDGYNTIKQWTTQGLSLVKPDRVAIACLCTFEKWKEHSPDSFKSFILSTISLVEFGQHPALRIKKPEQSKAYFESFIQEMGLTKSDWSKLMMNRSNGYLTTKQWLRKGDALRYPHSSAIAHANVLASWNQVDKQSFDNYKSNLLAKFKQGESNRRLAKSRHLTYIKSLADSRTDITPYYCPACHCESQTQTNSTQLDWETMIVCFECDTPFMKITQAQNGPVLTRRIEE